MAGKKWQQIAWFVGIWLAGVVLLSGVALIIKSVIL
jgi:hypothetical protein